MPQLQLQRRDDRDQVRVPAALAVAVHRALHQPRARLHRHERVRHGAAGVVVGVDADLDRVAELGHHARRGRAHVGRQRRAVRVAERHVLGARLGGRAQAAQGVVGVVAEGVEEVLRVVDHALALAGEERHRVRDHPQVLLGVHLGDLLEVERPGLAHERAHRGEAVGQHPQALVLARPSGRAGASCRRRRSSTCRSSPSRAGRRAPPPSGSRPGSRPRSDERPGRRARAPRGPSRRPRATCPRPASRRAGWCRRR